jgi:hypothetical protein
MATLLRFTADEGRQVKVYSDILTADDLYAAAEGNCGVWVCEPMRNTKVRSHGWNVSLTGSSPYQSQMGDYHRAATWAEHGIWMDRLFAIDPDARIAHYHGREDFRTQTGTLLESLVRYHGEDDARRRGYYAPWLEKASA